MLQKTINPKEARNKAFNDYNRQQMRNEHRMTQMVIRNKKLAEQCLQKSKELLRQNKKREAEDQYKMMQMYTKENEDIERTLDTQKMELVNLQRGMRYSETADMSRSSAVAFSKVASSIHVKKIERTNEIRAKSKESLDDKIGMLQSAHDEIRDEMMSAEHDDGGEGGGFSSFTEFADFVADLQQHELASELEAKTEAKPQWLIDLENAPDIPVPQHVQTRRQRQPVQVSPTTTESLSENGDKDDEDD